MIRIRGLRKRYGERVVLDGLSADVAEGETIAVVGPSGGGKSTLLRCLNYLEPFDAGEVDIAGFALRPGLGRGDADLFRRLRASVGMVFQEFHLFPHLSALENITLAPRILTRSSAEAAAAEGRELLSRVGLAERASAYPAELSGGQKQRVAIARALAQKPRVLLFDEPTSALDPGMRGEVLAVIRELSEKGMTLLVVTHEMQFAHDVADRVWVMNQGAIVEDGKPQDVVTQPKSTVAREFFRALGTKDS